MTLTDAALPSTDLLIAGEIPELGNPQLVSFLQCAHMRRYAKLAS
jgi:hypothetical protein